MTEEEKQKRFCLYYTNEQLAIHLTKLLPIPENGLVLESSAGLGSFVLATQKVYPTSKVTAVELLRSNCKELRKIKNIKVYHANFLGIHFGITRFDASIGNPPYTLAEEFVKQNFKFLKDGGHLGFLLRLNLLGSKKRYKFWQRYKPKKIYALSKRPSFTGDGGTDQTEYAFYVWQRGWTGSTEIEVVRF